MILPLSSDPRLAASPLAGRLAATQAHGLKQTSFVMTWLATQERKMLCAPALATGWTPTAALKMWHQPPPVVQRFSACRVGERMIAAITAAELEFEVVACGAAAARNRTSLAAFVRKVPGCRLTKRLHGPTGPCDCRVSGGGRLSTR